MKIIGFLHKQRVFNRKLGIDNPEVTQGKDKHQEPRKTKKSIKLCKIFQARQDTNVQNMLRKIVNLIKLQSLIKFYVSLFPSFHFVAFKNQSVILDFLNYSKNHLLFQQNTLTLLVP